MEKSSNFVINGGLKLPIGYRFHPTDEELLLHYLKKKVLNIPLPASVIPEFDVFQAHPNDLPGDLREKRYFFYNQKRNVNDEMCKRVSGCSGYWKPVIGKEKQIVASDNNDQRNRAFGVRKTLLFRERKRPRGRQTRWVMHEYHLLGLGINPNSFSQKFEMEVGEWVIFRIFQRKRRPRNYGIVSQPPNTKRTKITDMIRPSYLDYTVENVSVSGPPSPCLSFSSGVTEISFDGVVDDQEENSNPNLL
ncbi:hypothetical protein FEM48_Zijuj09G0225200 [Ziziphus jujuba var. spinosa]|uniref:NAC domain-containing protein n=1 Tax=Ziziphus jujuba var. spinosa TaxID=714518 RepID=A0A978UVP6_ZIZJJ|nr:hypothetical protein FEM48_Zijuj09G0225200 [Ziziphus jujuba var. spinosa]